MNQARGHFKNGKLHLLFLLCCLCLFPARADTDLSGQRIYRILCVGDAAANASSYQFPLLEKLLTAGYLPDYVGSQKTDSRVGALKNEVYSAQPIETVETNAAEAFRKTPADVVLVQFGGAPTPDALNHYEALIRSLRKINPQVMILIAQPARFPELAGLTHKLDTPGQRVIAVKPDDKAERMAEHWFNALVKILEPPKQAYHPKIVTYKNASGTNLTLHIFEPPGKFHGPHPAIVFFFGGGWKVGTPLQFYAECAHFAEEGFVAISADYRIASVEHTTPFESVTDGKSAIRWVRAHARQLHIDPQRIVGAGASAGGQVAAAAATVPGLNDPADNLAISPRPDALVLWYAVIDNGPGGYGYDRVKDRYQEISPVHNIDGHTPPPILFFLGTKDALIRVPTAAAFKARVDKAGGRCELKLFENAPHGFGDYRKGDNPLRHECVSAADDFLASLGFIGSVR